MGRLTKAEVENMLKKTGMRITSHRLLLLQEIAKSKEPLTVYSLVEILREKGEIDQATVYRNLSALYSVRLLRRLDFNHGHSHYEIETGEPSHVLVCSTCETVEKIDNVNIDDSLKKMIKKSKKFKKTTSHSVEIYGICKKCTK